MSSAAGHEVTVIGNAIVDEIHRGGRVEEQLGGNGFNVAVALGSSGVRTCLVARFAADDAGRAFVESLRLRGVTIVRQPAIVSTDRARAFLTGPEPHYEFSSTLHLNVDFSPEVIATLGTSRAVVVNSYPFENLDDVEDLLAALQEVQGMPRAGSQPPARATYQPHHVHPTSGPASCSHRYRQGKLLRPGASLRQHRGGRDRDLGTWPERRYPHERGGWRRSAHH